jgi:integrase
VGRPNKVRYRADRDTWVTKVNGSLVTLASGKANKKEADRAFHELMASVGRSQKPGSSIRVAALFDIFLDTVSRERAALTYEWYVRYLSSAAESFGNLPAEDIRALTVTAWLDSHPAWGQSTRSGAITAVKRAFRWGKKSGAISTNPIADMEKPGIAERESIPSAEQVNSIFATIRDEAFRTFLEVVYNTGMRPSEAMAIEARHHDRAASTLTMDSKTTRVTRRKRVIVLTPRINEVLAGLAEVNPTGPLLRNLRGRPWTRNATASRFKRLREKLGMGREGTTEAFRHRFATDALVKGVPTATVAAMLGHVTETMVVRRYSKIHQNTEHLRELVQRIRPDSSTASVDTEGRPDVQQEREPAS